jgi:hypothetical protein
MNITRLTHWLSPSKIIVIAETYSSGNGTLLGSMMGFEGIPATMNTQAMPMALSII